MLSLLPEVAAERTFRLVSAAAEPVPPGDARCPDQPLGRRTSEVRSLDLIDALSEIDGRARNSNAPPVHHVDAVGDC